MVLFEFSETGRICFAEKGHKHSPSIVLDVSKYRYLVHNDDVDKVSMSSFRQNIYVLNEQPRVIRFDIKAGVYAGYPRYPHKVLRYDVTTFGAPYTWWDDAIEFEYDIRDMWDMNGLMDTNGSAKNHPVLPVRELYESGLLLTNRYKESNIVFSRFSPENMLKSLESTKGGHQLFIKTKDGEVNVIGIKGTLDKFNMDNSDIEWLAARDTNENVTFFLTDKETLPKDIIAKYVPNANVLFIEIDPVEFVKDISSRTKEQVFDSAISWNKYVAPHLEGVDKNTSLVFTLNGEIVSSTSTAYTNANSFNSTITQYVVYGVKKGLFSDGLIKEFVDAQMDIYDDLEYFEGY